MSELTATTIDNSAAFSTVVYLVEERRNPSTDFFVLPAFAAAGCQVVRCGAESVPEPSALQGAVVVFVRYIPQSWRSVLDSLRPRLQRLIFFMDDDVLDPRAAVGMPWRYRFKLARMSARHKRWLLRIGAELWVSSPFLQQKYAAWNPVVILPHPVPVRDDHCHVFYHGSASHAAEMRWLRPVIAEALRQEDRLTFEVIGGSDVHRIYRGMPRVQVVHPLRWPAYQAFLARPGRHVGLAPLLDLPFNRARSFTKFFDITGCGAVGIYAQQSEAARIVADQGEGLVVPMDPAAWVDAILRLAGDEPFRLKLLAGAQRRQALLAQQALQGYASLLSTGA